MDSFKNVINIRRFFELPEVNVPPIEIKQVEVPKAIENYLEKRTHLENGDHTGRDVNKKKRKNDSQTSSKLALGDNLCGLADSVNKRYKIDVISEKTKSHKNKKYS